MVAVSVKSRLEDQDREQLLHTSRRLLAEADALSSRIAAVNEIGIAINRTLDLDEIERVIARQAKWLLDFEHCSVCWHEGGNWKINTLFGNAETMPPDFLNTTNAGRAIRFSQPQLLRSGSESPFLDGYRSQMIIPLIADDMVLGTINFAAIDQDCYSQDDMRIGYMLGLQLASAIRNARNFQELNRTRDELRLYAAELEARNQELDAYGHTIAHDLRSPLSSVLLRSEIVLNNFSEALPPRGRSLIEGVHESATQMNEMIGQLLWLAKLRKVTDALKPVDVTPVAQAALRRFSHQTEHFQIEVMAEMPAALGHAQWIEEVFANLISNAVKYIGEDNPAPRLWVRGFADGETARYEVQDNGIGISPEDQAHLFEMFTRLNVVNVDGLGLGLSIVHRIVSKLNGTVTVESTPGVGSTFAFTLPAASLASADEMER